MAFLGDVFTLSGIPSVTFVEPTRFDEIKVSLRTPGRCMVIEGPSGIGKTTTVSKAIAEIGLSQSFMTLSARKQADIEMIVELPNMKDIGQVIVDDFHRLPDEVKAKLSDFMKVLADAQDPGSKLILIGINKAGQQLVKFAHDLGLRIDVFRLEANPNEKVLELIELGERALNIEIQASDAVAEKSQGSFQIAQLLCHKLCVLGKATETEPSKRTVETSINVAIEDVMIDLARQFKEPALMFARGSKLRKEGRAPYLHILRWLADSDEWSLDLVSALNEHSEHRASIGQVLDKGFLVALLNDPEKALLLSPHFHFEPSTSILSVEDPKMIFYLKNIIWRVFTRQVGYTADYFEGRYDFALSFAGSERAIARRLYELLSEREIATFYDENEQHRIIAQNVEDYLAPIYRSEARYVLPLLSSAYPTRIWTKFESDQFNERFGQNAVVPIRFTDTQPGYFSNEHKYGALSFDPTKEAEPQLQNIAETLSLRLIEDRNRKDE
jgi:hypothetical protein